MRQLNTITMTRNRVTLLRHKIPPAYTDPDSILNGKELIGKEIIYRPPSLTPPPPPQKGKNI